MNKLIKHFKNVKKKTSIYLISSKAGKHSQVIKTLVEQVINKNNLKCDFITLNKPHKIISTEIKSHNLFFIDAVSKEEKSCSPGKCRHVNGLQSLTNLSITITESVNKKKTDFIILDSISTLLVYNNPNLTEKFIRFLINKIRSLGINAILLGIDDEATKKIYNNICQVSDKCINLS